MRIYLKLFIFIESVYAMEKQNTFELNQFESSFQIIRFQEEKHNELYRELVNKNNTSGLYVGVKTTGIACRFGCRARPPLQKNCIFSKKLHDLICYGFRECKVCKPLSYNAPENVKGLLEEIQKDSAPNKKFDSQYKQPTEWIKSNSNTDLLKYVCAKRSNSFLKNQTDIVLSSHKNLTYQRYWTPIGVMLACFSNQGLCLLEFSDRRMLEAELINLQKKYKAKFIQKNTILSKQLEKELDEYFKGTLRLFTIPLDQKGTDFQIIAWKALRNIAYGEKSTYKEQAIISGNANAIKAIATANGMNSISLIVPCHRIIGENGMLMGYGGGIDRKKYLLDFEAHNLTQDKLNQIEINKLKKRKNEQTLLTNAKYAKS